MSHIQHIKGAAYLFVLFLSLSLISGLSAHACNVPVFRYALERWYNDPYELIVFHRGALTAEQAAVVESMKNPPEPSYRYANAAIATVDLDSPDVSDAMKGLYDRLESKTLPCIAVRYPGESPNRLAFWTAPLTMESLAVILDSPARRAIAERILNGESSIFVMLDSGNAAKDNAAVSQFEKEFPTLESTLQLPDALDGNEAAAPVDLSHGPELRVDFSLLRISRSDPKEAFFIRALMHTEPDLFDYVNEPTVFPVYGRGRALYALIGGGITEDNIYAACRFLTGACSCEVKNLNPGVDMLMAVDWDGGLGGNLISDKLPPLVGMAEMVQSASQSASTAEADSGNTTEISPLESSTVVNASDGHTDIVPVGGSPLKRNIVIVFTLIAAAVVALTLIIGRRKAEKL